MLIVNMLVEPGIATYMAHGVPDILHSKYHLSYAMPVITDRHLLSV